MDGQKERGVAVTRDEADEDRYERLAREIQVWAQAVDERIMPLPSNRTNAVGVKGVWT